MGSTTPRRRLGENEAAADHLRDSLEGSPSPGTACRILAETLSDLGRTDEAIAAYREAMTHGPEMKNLHYVIADIVYKKAKTDEEKQQAIDAYLAALKAAPRDPSARKAYRTLAKLYYKQANHEKALENYVKASKLEPKDSGLHYNVGVLYNKAHIYPQFPSVLPRLLDGHRAEIASRDLRPQIRE